MDLSAQEARVAFRSPTSIEQPEAPVETLASFVVERGTPRVERTA